MVIARERGVAQLLLFERAARQLDGAFALAVRGLGLGAVTRRGFGPIIDLLADRCFLVVGARSRSTMRLAFVGDDLRMLLAALRQVREDLPSAK